jgi:hypothetical protein
MRRRQGFLPRVAVLLAVTSLIAAVSLTPATSLSEAGARRLGPQGAHTITVTPWGPDQATIDGTKRRLSKHPALQTYLKGKRYRMLSFDFVESAVKVEKPEPPSSYRATFFDYTSNRAIIASGRFSDYAVFVSFSTTQPLPSPEEFEAAVRILSKDSTFGPAIKAGTLQPYPPMPPLVDISLPIGKVERTVTVGLLPNGGKASHEIVGVNMIRESVSRYFGGAPPTSNAAELNCGVQSAAQSTTTIGTTGQFQIAINRGAQEIWSFLVIRPSASSGNNRSGIELRDVKFRGKLVLARANVPILNVQYYRNACGPFRDWAWQEGKFVANGTLLVADNPQPSDGGMSGILQSTSEPQTVLDNGTDAGNFRGVAIYDREEVTLVSELNAGWYRYINKWIFNDEGIISPRFGFGGTINSCVCNGHIHHVYWRFDFDIKTADNNFITEDYHGLLNTISTESMRPRLASDQFWLVQNSVTGETVIIKPGRLDGNYDKYGHGDIWFLRNHFPSEIDDSGLGSGTDAHIDPMVNSESILNQDVVVWYGAHWRHDHFDTPNEGPNLCGPDLVLQKY